MDARRHDGDEVEHLRERVREAGARRASLTLRGSGSKDFLGNAGAGDVLDLRSHAGIVRYAPRELVITARAGTRLQDLEAVLAENMQMLAFEPPHFGPDATLGGTIACGLSGPRRANSGSARDFVLGVRILDGRGEELRFGGEVIKNVAGYDLSRLMTGAFGTLGILLDLSLRVVPRARAEQTRVLELDAATALQRVRAWSLQALPISASAIFDGRLFVRLSGAASAVQAAAANIGGELPDGNAFWHRLREHDLPFFEAAGPLWRLSVSPGSELMDLGAPQLIEWHGAQRWVKTDVDAARVRAHAQAGGGHATLFRAEPDAMLPDGRFHPLPAGLFALHRRLKSEFDPHGVFNRGRLYPGL